MGKQIQLLQTTADIDIFMNLFNEMQLNVFFSNGKMIKDKSEVRYGQQFFLSINNKIKNNVEGLRRETIEYCLPEFFHASNLKNIISNGRLWIDTNADKTLQQKYELLSKWIRKHYTHVDKYWFASNCIEEVKKGTIIAATNFGLLQIVDDKLNVIFKETWKKNSKYKDGE